MSRLARIEILACHVRFGDGELRAKDQPGLVQRADPGFEMGGWELYLELVQLGRVRAERCQVADHGVAGADEQVTQLGRDELFPLGIDLGLGAGRREQPVMGGGRIPPGQDLVEPLQGIGHQRIQAADADLFVINPFDARDHREDGSSRASNWQAWSW